MFDRKTMLKWGMFLLVVLGGALLVTSCATKKYVKQQIDPLTGKVAEVEAISKKNSQDIRDVDSRAQAGIQAASQKADAADSKATLAGQKADAAQSTADQIARNVKGVESRLGNLDSFKLTDTVEVNFETNRYNLDVEAKAKLDALAAKVKDQRAFVFEIEGFTDGRGTEMYNLELSQKRAETVKRYLASNGNIPLFRMSIIGVGKDKPVDDNKTKEGRARNRRVEIRLLRSTV
jgi:OOP family OmpA-OmpF porin